MMQVARTGTRGAAQHAVLFISITILSAPRTVEATSYPYVGCLGPPSGWARPGGDVAISAAGAEHCRTICKDLGYTYFAMECPRGSIVHCQCNNALSGTSIPDNYCEGTGNPLVHSHDHCVGPYTADEYRFGDYTVCAVFTVNGPSCPAGTYSASGRDEGGVACISCPAGTFQANEGQSHCSSCAAGTFQASTGQSACENCAAGTFQINTGQSACENCAAGTFQINTGQSACGSCPGGQFSASTGSVACTSCDAGKYSSASAATECSPCPSGQFQMSTGQLSCLSTEAPTPLPTFDPTMHEVTTLSNSQVTSPRVRTELLEAEGIILNGVSLAQSRRALLAEVAESPRVVEALAEAQALRAEFVLVKAMVQAQQEQIKSLQFQLDAQSRRVLKLEAQQEQRAG